MTNELPEPRQGEGIFVRYRRRSRRSSVFSIPKEALSKKTAKHDPTDSTYLDEVTEQSPLTRKSVLPKEDLSDIRRTSRTSEFYLLVTDHERVSKFSVERLRENRFTEQGH